MLPTHRKNNTAVMVMIQHQPVLEVSVMHCYCIAEMPSLCLLFPCLCFHSSPIPTNRLSKASRETNYHPYIPIPLPFLSPLSQNGPRLLDADKNVLASGREDIAKYITTENDSVRSNEKKKVRL